MRCKICGAVFSNKEPYCPKCGTPILDSLSVHQEPKKEKKQGSSAQKEHSPAKYNENARWISAFVAFEGLAACVAGLFMPFFEVRVLGAGVSLPLWSEKFRDDVIIFLVLLALGGVYVLFFKQNKGYVNMGLGAAVILLSFFEMLVNMEKVKAEGVGSLVDTGNGFYMIIFGGVLLINSGMILRVMNSKGAGG